tara:strand:- start:43 stop:405 length:363 start_codon:yes stop_codon:yes gene_type:complete
VESENDDTNNHSNRIINFRFDILGGVMTKIRPIVRAAYKVDELLYQFYDIDIPDGYLETASIEEVNEKYNDSYLVGEAKNRLSIVQDQLDSISKEGSPEDWKVFNRDKRQLTSFINKWGE